MTIYERFQDKSRKKIAVLIDPDKPTDAQVLSVVAKANAADVDFFFVGGSLLTTDSLEHCIKVIKANSNIPVLIFPGNSLQISKYCDGFLLLSLISGRNPEMLIGRHVIAAPYLKLFGNEIIPTGYMLIDSGRQTSVSYMSDTTPIPHDKDDIAMCTAMAGEMLGLKLIYLEGGSGAVNPVSDSMISKVRQMIDIPLIVGGGISTPEMAAAKARAGADVICVGTRFEEEPELLQRFADAVHTAD
ncbi:MAG: geranylgeranylglyceryl/heptaprenylglyceryl phosphate synthase [bacterium]|nr:geranylgeranylglyceryl/heptaprenylglyceryl phosphate synthase [Candidatus Limimorpha caballi]MCQ2316884.1 geranylgeranylglyceryl/heptaprenylglyceryl phosphate synthase [Bacteroidales bacterium]